MILKIHRRGAETLVAACDEDLLGKTIDCDGVKLCISKSFYGEESVEDEDLISALRQCTTANLVGARTIEVAVKAGFIDESGVMRFDETPHAQIYKMM